MRELSFVAVFFGIVIGALLAAANAFVGLKVGMTISASIPAAVMSLLILRTLLKRKSLLESNMVQTIGSAGESAAAGMIFTIPALLIMGEDAPFLEMVMWGGIGGLLGVCFMVPLRQVLIVREHGVLPYPEGVACAEVLESGERGGAGARSVIWGAIVGAVYYMFAGLGLFKETGKNSIERFRTEFQVDSSPALLGVGYILGPRVAAYMLGGAVMSWFILIPAIAFFGEGAAQPIYPETDKVIASMSPDDIYKRYIKYIGAGAVAIGGLISLVKSFKTIGASIWHVLAGIFSRGKGKRDRTQKDFPFLLLLLIVSGLAYAMWELPHAKLQHNTIGVVAVVVFTFFFVTVSSRLVGLVGCSSNPVSGMTIATLLATALVYKFFVVDKAANPADVDITSLKLSCLTVGAIVCIAISVAGDTSQDLKTGFLLKATPYKQQFGEMIGVLTAVVAIAGVILLLNKTQGFVKTTEQPYPLLAPQANIMKLLVEGVLGGSVPWTLIMMGGATAIVVEMLGLPALPFAVGMYLPLGLSTPIMVGGIIAWLVSRKQKDSSEHNPGVLTASGLVAGQGLMGVTLAGAAALITWWWQSPRWTNPIGAASDQPEAVAPLHFAPWIWEKVEAIPVKWGLSEAWWDALPMVPFLFLVLWLWWCAKKRPPIEMPPTGSSPASPPTRPVSDEPRSPSADGGLDDQPLSPIGHPTQSSSPASSTVAPPQSPRYAAQPSPGSEPTRSSIGNVVPSPLTTTPSEKFGPPEPVVPPVSNGDGSEVGEIAEPPPSDSGQQNSEEEDEHERTIRRLGPPRDAPFPTPEEDSTSDDSDSEPSPWDRPGSN